MRASTDDSDHDDRHAVTFRVDVSGDQSSQPSITRGWIGFAPKRWTARMKSRASIS